jgi:uncharacterized protein (TIRG00374 family)
MSLNKNNLLCIIGFLILIFYLNHIVDFNEIIYKLKNADISYLSIALFLSLSQIFTATLRFYLFLKASNCKYELYKCFRCVCTSIAYNSLLPSKAGDFLKAIILTNDKSKRTELAGVVIIERIIDLLSLFLIGLFGLLLSKNTKLFFIFLSALVIFAALVFLIFKIFNHTKFSKFLSIIINLIKLFRVNYLFSTLALITSILFWIINVIIISILLLSFGVKLPLIEVLAFWPFSIVVGILPLSISGFGTRDIAFMNLIDIPALCDSIFSATFMYTVMLYWVLSVVCILFNLIINNNDEK